MRLLDILFRRSPRNAAVPNVQPGPAGASGWPSTGSPVQPLERNIEVRSIAGLLNELRRVDSRYRSADGEIISCCEDREGIVLGCGHTATQFQAGTEKNSRDRRIAGLCAYCIREYQTLLERGQIDPLHAERLSLVCSDCAQMSTSGYLCCPRHRTKTTAPDGTTHYIDPEAAKSMSRQNIIAKALNAVMWVFGEPQKQQEHEIDQE